MAIRGIDIARELDDLALFLSRNYGAISFVLVISFLVFHDYIFYSVPHCCEDINYLFYHSPEQRLQQFWARTASEGRWFFAICTAIVSGHVVPYLFALAAVVASALTGMFLASLLGANGKIWIPVAILLALNPFLLVLYPWPVSFAFFSVANLLVVLSFFCYTRNSKWIVMVPFATMTCVATYQPTLSFLLVVVCLHFLLECFDADRNSLRKLAKFYGLFLLAVLAGYLAYFLLLKILLFAHGDKGFLRAQLWGHRQFAGLTDYLRHGWQLLKWFRRHGIESGLDPASSVMVGTLSVRTPFVTSYTVALGLMNAFLAVRGVWHRSAVQLAAAGAVIPVTAAVTLLPLTVSGSGIINRVFYPFGLVLPALVLALGRQSHGRSFRVAVWAIVLTTLLGDIVFHAQFSTGIARQANFAKAEHKAFLQRLFAMPGYDLNSNVLIYPYTVEQQELSRKPEVVDWPFLSLNASANLKQLIKYYQAYEVNLVGLQALGEDKINKVEAFIRRNNIRPWPYRESVFFLPDVEGGLYVIYYPYSLLPK